MNTKLYFLGLLVFLKAVLANGQDSTKRLNFILIIDKEVANPSGITDTYFEIKHKNSQLKEVIPCDDRVGMLLLKSTDYDKLFSLKRSDSLFVNFKFSERLKGGWMDTEYRHQIPVNWINKEYIIFYV